ncbi:hypothetical protein PSH79_10105 [Pseudomonas sp. FP2196]|uniref:hypothetical protein n=1 Tax=Pseudomonas sp. FP2196 TaxID=2954086 RepID=UPI0027377783|nr:hypothetical protein [Pseudomonas sp. FP2196]WLH37625.1 hypothetical protein PSH79_10105 [Pseudomonas sp. FP2196]
MKPTQAEFQSGWATLDVTYSLQEKNRILIEIDGKELERSEPLHPHDLQLIGELIQIYNYVEFNLRRCIELFTHAGMIVKTDKTPPLVHLSSVAMKGISQTEDGEIWAEHFAEIELHRDVRNQLAHWAARHISGESALLILSMNSAESKKRTAKISAWSHSQTYEAGISRILKSVPITS